MHVYKFTFSKCKLHPVKRMKNKPHTGRNYFAITYVTKDLIQNTRNSENLKTNNPI